MSSKCDGCGNTFLAGTKKIEYKGHQWHDTCFHCKVCATKVGQIVLGNIICISGIPSVLQVGAKSFIIPNDKDIYCVTCFEDKIATKCVKCKKVLTSGGVTFRNEPWHKVSSTKWPFFRVKLDFKFDLRWPYLTFGPWDLLPTPPSSPQNHFPIPQLTWRWRGPELDNSINFDNIPLNVSSISGMFCVYQVRRPAGWSKVCQQRRQALLCQLFWWTVCQKMCQLWQTHHGSGWDQVHIVWEETLAQWLFRLWPMWAVHGRQGIHHWWGRYHLSRVCQGQVDGKQLNTSSSSISSSSSASSPMGTISSVPSVPGTSWWQATENKDKYSKDKVFNRKPLLEEWSKNSKGQGCKWRG